MAEILVIDDEADIRNVLKTILEEGGHRVRLAAEGRDALRQYASSPADVVITDLHMPGMNGLETVHALRSASTDVKIIAMSGASQFMADKNLESSIINGADVTFTKPFPMQTVLHTVAHLLAPAQG